MSSPPSPSLRPPPPVFSAAGALEYPVIGFGGALGALARHAVGLWLTSNTGWIPWQTLFVNVSGALAVGLLVGLLRPRTPHPLLRPFLIVGVFGSFTTFSTFGIEFWQLIGAGRAGAALAYAALTPVVGIGAFVLGHHLGHRLAGTPA